MMERPLSPDQVQLVLQRAAELERRPGHGPDEALSPADVAEIGKDVGLAPEAVRRALDELDAGVLPASLPARSLADRVIGPAEVVHERVVRGIPGVVRAEVTRFLESQLLTVHRNFGERVVWTRARGVWPAVLRALDVNARLAFAAGSEVESLVVSEPGTHEAEQRTRVRLVLRVEESRQRRAHRALAGVAAGALVTALALLAAHGLAPDLIGAGAGLAVAGGTTAAARRGQTREVRRASDTLLRFLDVLEHER